MDTLVDFLIQHGQLGMFISAFLAGSILPFSSEVVMAALQLGGADPWGLVLWGTLGNTLGGLLNYGITLFPSEWKLLLERIQQLVLKEQYSEALRLNIDALKKHIGAGRLWSSYIHIVHQ